MPVNTVQPHSGVFFLSLFHTYVEMLWFHYSSQIPKLYESSVQMKDRHRVEEIIESMRLAGSDALQVQTPVSPLRTREEKDMHHQLKKRLASVVKYT